MRTNSAACCALLDRLGPICIESVTVGYNKKGLHVILDDVAADGPKVSSEFNGLAVIVHQSPNPVKRHHERVESSGIVGCIHSQWDRRQYERRGTIPNRDCYTLNTQEAKTTALVATD